MEFGFEDLVSQVERQGGDAIEQLARATAKSKEVSAMADALLDAFVQKARDAGVTWTQIGEVLDVSKQAAQQRGARLFKNLSHRGAVEIIKSRVGSKPMFGRFTDKARKAVSEARELSATLNHSSVGTEHLLVGIYRIGGVGAQALTDLGLSLDAVTSAVAEIGGPDEAAGARPSFTPEAKRTLERSLQEALKMGHNYIGTEHIALALVELQHGTADGLIAETGIDAAALRARIASILEERRGAGAKESSA